jgi:hypothetical protein
MLGCRSGKMSVRDADDMSEFIVQSDDEEEDEKDARRALKKSLGKRRAQVAMDLDDEEVLFGVRQKGVSNEAIKQMRFLPSSKMKVCQLRKTKKYVSARILYV